MDGEAKEDNTTRDDGLIPVVWKVSTNMTDAEYNYTVSYSNIVLAQTVKGSFCIGKNKLHPFWTRICNLLHVYAYSRS